MPLFDLLMKLPKAPLNDVTGVGTTNFFTAFSAFAFFCVGILALAHRVFWPALARLTYTLAEIEVLRNRKRLFCVGAILLSFSGYGTVFVPDVLDKLKGIFG